MGSEILGRKLAVIGLGASGLAVAEHALSQGFQVCLYDDRSLEDLGDLPDTLSGAKLVTSLDMPLSAAIVSPGMPRSHPQLQLLRRHGVPLLSDIDYFCCFADPEPPVIAVTGTNGKSSVVSLLNHIFSSAGWRSQALGNIGQPPISVVEEPADVRVFELSSYQLARTHWLRPRISVCLNIAPDHLTWHGSMRHYIAAKHRVHRHSQCRVVTDALEAEVGADMLIVSDDTPSDESAYGVLSRDGSVFLARGQQHLMAADDVPWTGPHAVGNALTCWAIAAELGVADAAIAEGVKTWPGLPYRCQRLGSLDGVDWFNDSKATNTHAQCQALDALAGQYRGIILLAGGQLKSQDYRHLPAQMPGKVSHAVLFGQDKLLLKQAWQDHWSCHLAKDLASAAELARSLAESGMAVLFSPGGASFDAFPSYMARGRHFTELWRSMSDAQQEAE